MQFKIEPHSFKSDNLISRIIGRAICTGCSLVKLRNPLTDWCISKGCNYSEHPGYKEACRTLPATHPTK
jgi:hypothetical protein